MQEFQHRTRRNAGRLEERHGLVPPSSYETFAVAAVAHHLHMRCGSAPPNQTVHMRLYKALHPGRLLSTHPQAEDSDSTPLEISVARHLAIGARKSALRGFPRMTHWPKVFSNGRQHEELNSHKGANQSLPNRVVPKTHIQYSLLYSGASRGLLKFFDNSDECDGAFEL
jgi:hypothetical protein